MASNVVYDRRVIGFSDKEYSIKTLNRSFMSSLQMCVRCGQADMDGGSAISVGEEAQR
jgi:hypothetical protein